MIITASVFKIKPRGMARESEPVILSGLGAAWYGNPEVRDRLSLEAPSSLILPASGEKVPIASQETAVVNDMFLIPIIIQMRAASSLKIPSLETIAEELEALWIKYHEARQKRAYKGRNPKLASDFKLPDHVQAICITDSKHIKTLLSMMKKQFQSERVAREPQLH